VLFTLIALLVGAVLTSCQDQGEEWLEFIYMLQTGQYQDPDTKAVYDLEWSSAKNCWVLTYDGDIWYYDGKDPEKAGRRFDRYLPGGGGVILPPETKGIFLHIPGIIDYFEDDANDASAQLGAFSDFISTDGDLGYDRDAAEILEGVFDFTAVRDYDDFLTQCETGAGEMDGLTIPSICSYFHANAIFLLEDPWYVLHPYYEWGTNNQFLYTQGGNTLDMSATLAGEEIFDITLTKDESGEITVSGTILGDAVSTTEAAHPILVYQPFIDEANEWGYDKGEDPGDPPE